MALPLLTALPPDTQLILTPFKIAAYDKEYTVFELPIYKDQSGKEMYGWENCEELFLFFKQIGHDCEVTKEIRYLMVGALDVDHKKEQYFTNALPQHVGVIFKDEPQLDYNELRDICLKGSGDEDVFCWDTREVYSQNIPFRHIKRFIKDQPIVMRLSDIIPPPTADEIHLFFHLSLTIPIPVTALPPITNETE